MRVIDYVEENLILDNGVNILLTLDKVVNFFKNGGCVRIRKWRLSEIIAAKEKVVNITSMDNAHQSLLAWHLEIDT